MSCITSFHSFKVVLTLFYFFNRRWSSRFHYPLIDQISFVNTPILIVHGDLDYKVPISNSYQLLDKAVRSGKFLETDFRTAKSQSASNPIQVQMISGARHDNAFQHIEWLQSLSSFIRHVES